MLNRTAPEGVLPCWPCGSNIPPRGAEISSNPQSILHYVYRCLFSPRVSAKVTGVVMDMTSDLLESEGEGVWLVLGHVPTLLVYLSGRVRGREPTAVRREGGNFQLELSVLSKYEMDTDICAILHSSS